MTIDSTSRELIDDCLSRISNGNARAAFDLASAFMSHADSRDIGLNLVVVEALATLAKAKGCPEAVAFLDGQRPHLGARLPASL
jgi:hypothetical protein